MATKISKKMIRTANLMIEDLLRTEVTACDIVTALEKHCSDLGEEDQEAVLRLAQEIAEEKGNDLVFNIETKEQMAEMVHYCFVAYELADHLDLPVLFVWSAEEREQNYLERTILYPLPPR